jgi:hypothetical protein
MRSNDLLRSLGGPAQLMLRLSRNMKRAATEKNPVADFVLPLQRSLSTDEHTAVCRPIIRIMPCVVRLTSTSLARSTRTRFEGFWSIFKRGLMGTFHKVSREYLPLYVAEFQWRYNNRENPDIFAEAIRGC